MKNLELFNNILMAANCEPISVNESFDWGLDKELSESYIVQMANDLLSEIGSIKCENKNLYQY
jgi:hypothetical protein